MIKFENSLVINCPLEEVFDFLANFENMPRWNYFVVKVKGLTPEPPGLGKTFDLTRKTDKHQLRIIEYEQNRRVTFKTVSDRPSLVMRFNFEPEGTAATRLRDEWELKTGIPGFLDRLGTGRVKAAVAENLAKLKELLETGRVTLQDGRKETL